MKFDYKNIINSLVLAALLGVASYLYATTEQVKKLETEVAVAKSEQDRSKEDIKEIKTDVKEVKQKQDDNVAEVKGLLKEVLEAAKKKQK